MWIQNSIPREKYPFKMKMKWRYFQINEDLDHNQYNCSIENTRGSSSGWRELTLDETGRKDQQVGKKSIRNGKYVGNYKICFLS